MKARASFTGKIAIVTGGASGIGAALGTELAARGATVVLADRQLELAHSVAARIAAQSPHAASDVAYARALDVRDAAAFQALVAEVVARHGRLDFLFNNAGISVGGEIDAYRQADWDDVFAVNLHGVTHGIQAAYPVMVRQRAGHIVNTGSIAGLFATPAQASYSASKHAVVGLSKALRIEARRHGVRVSVLCPGAIATPLLGGGHFGRLNIPGLRAADMVAIIELLRPMAPERFARRALDAVLRDEAFIVVPRMWRALWYLERVAPEMSLRLWGVALAKLRRDLARAVRAHGSDRG